MSLSLPSDALIKDNSLSLTYPSSCGPLLALYYAWKHA